jgi:shikimate kinase
MKIILLGYMASGKSTVGSLLAKIVDFNFIDLDSFIERKEEMSISEIFTEKGEVYFRKIENIYLKELLLNYNNCIISLGGGTPCYSNNMDLILSNKETLCFFLKTSINEIVIRLMKEKDQRPLVAQIESKESLKEFVGKHLFERNPFYLRSDFIINTDQKTKEDIVEEIVFKLF